MTTNEDDGPKRTYAGKGVCTLPGVFPLVLTWPYQRGGRIVEIPLSKVESVIQVELREIGGDPSIG